MELKFISFNFYVSCLSQYSYRRNNEIYWRSGMIRSLRMKIEIRVQTVVTQLLLTFLFKLYR